jgi:hypothetical protein
MAMLRELAALISVSLEQGEPESGPPSFQSLAGILEAATQLQHGYPIRRDLLQLLDS